MSCLLVPIGLALSLAATGQDYIYGYSFGRSYNHLYRQGQGPRKGFHPWTRLYARYLEQPPKWVFPPGPGYGWGFPNGNPDGYGYFDVGDHLPLGLNAGRTTEYYFRRYFSVPGDQMFLPNYFNPYVTRGQRYLSFAGDAPGFHPAGGPPPGSADTPRNPYNETIGSGPRVSIPTFSGRVEAAPVNSGGTGLTP